MYVEELITRIGQPQIVDRMYMYVEELIAPPARRPAAAWRLPRHTTPRMGLALPPKSLPIQRASALHMGAWSRAIDHRLGALASTLATASRTKVDQTTALGRRRW